MKKNWQHIIKTGPCPSIDKLALYSKGKLSKKESFVIENHLAGCEICSDLLEGLAEIKDAGTLAKTEAEIKQRINKLLYPEQKQRRMIPLYQRLAIAASILLLISVSIFLFKNFEKPFKSVSQNEIQKNLPVPGKIESEIKSEPLAAVSKTVERKQEIAQTEPRSEIKISKSSPKVRDELSPEINEEVVSKDNTKADYKVSASKKETQKLEISNEMPVYASESVGKSSEKALKIEYGNDNKSTIRKITGKVMDENGMALPGVNVVIKGTTIGTLTDVEGKFTILVKPQNTILDVSMVGYKTQELPVNNNDTLLIAMNEEVKKLDEVVVIGYGAVKKSDLTGAVTSVRSSEMSVADKKRNKNLVQIDSLKNILKNDNQNREVIKQLVEKYLELSYQQEAMYKLNDLRKRTYDTAQIKAIDEIIQLTKDAKYNKALKKLKKIK